MGFDDFTKKWKLKGKEGNPKCSPETKCKVTIAGTAEAVSVTCETTGHSGLYPEGKWFDATPDLPERIESKEGLSPVYVIVKIQNGIECKPAPADDAGANTGSWTADDSPSPDGE